jgi:hypothetical protein
VPEANTATKSEHEDFSQTGGLDVSRADVPRSYSVDAPAPASEPAEKTPAQRTADLHVGLLERIVEGWPEEDRRRRESETRQDEATRKLIEANRQGAEEQIKDIQANRQWREQHPRPEPPQTPAPPQFHLTPPPGLFGDNSTSRGQNAPGNQWMQAITQFGAMGSGMDRRSSMAAIASMTGMLEGWAKGEKQQFDEQYRTWQAQTKNIEDNYRRQTEYYDAILSDNKLSMQEKQQELALRAAEFKDTITQELAVQGRLDQVDKLQDTRAQVVERLANAQKKLEQTVNSAQVTPEARTAAALWIEQGIRPATRRAQDLNAIYAAIREYGDDHGWTEEQTRSRLATATKEFASAGRSVTAFDVGRQGDIVRSLNVSIQHLDVYEQAANALNNRDAQGFNAVKNFIQTQFGYPAPTNFEQVKNIVADEVLKGTLGTPGGVRDREAFAANLRAINSPAQFAGQLRLTKLLLAGQMVGLRQQYESSTGLMDFDSKLLPRTLDAMRDVQEGTLSPGAAGITPPSRTWPMPSAKAIETLRTNPAMRELFEQQFGPGSASKVLGDGR